MNDNESDPHQFDAKAYLNVYPLVSIGVTCGQVANIEAGQIPGRAPIWQFARITGLPTANWQAAVRSNSDLKRAMRICTPRPEALDGRWDPPPVCRGVAGGRRCRELGS